MTVTETSTAPDLAELLTVPPSRRWTLADLAPLMSDVVCDPAVWRAQADLASIDPERFLAACVHPCGICGTVGWHPRHAATERRLVLPSRLGVVRDWLRQRPLPARSSDLVPFRHWLLARWIEETDPAARHELERLSAETLRIYRTLAELERT